MAASQSMDVSITDDDLDNAVLEGIAEIRKLLSVESAIDEAIQYGAVPLLVDCLKSDDFPQLQNEAAWSLAKITSGTKEHVQEVITSGAVPILVNQLSSPVNNVREQVMWALSNIVVHSPHFRDLVLAQGALEPLIAELETAFVVITTKRVATWLLFILCTKKLLHSQVKARVGRVLAQILIHSSNDEDVLKNTIMALAHVSGGANTNVQYLIDSGVCQQLAKLLLHPSFFVVLATLRVVGNISLGNHLQTQHLIDQGMLRCFSIMLTREPHILIKLHICQTIANITARNREQKQAVISAGLIGPMVHFLKEAELKLKIEAARVITNFTDGGTRKQIVYLVDQNCIPPLCDMLVCSDSDIVSECLSALHIILEVGESMRGETAGVNEMARMIEQARGFDNIKALQNHANDGIHDKSVEILKKYYW